MIVAAAAGIVIASGRAQATNIKEAISRVFCTVFDNMFFSSRSRKSSYCPDQPKSGVATLTFVGPLRSNTEVRRNRMGRRPASCWGA